MVHCMYGVRAKDPLWGLLFWLCCYMPHCRHAFFLHFFGWDTIPSFVEGHSHAAFLKTQVQRATSASKNEEKIGNMYLQKSNYKLA